MSVGFVLAILFSGLITGGLARLAIPGPDPMPLWLTIAIGLTGSIVGAVVGSAVSNDNGYVVSFLSFGVAMALVAAYRRFVQQRPIFGPGALRLPERGLGVEQHARAAAEARRRPDALRADPHQLERVRLEAMLQELHRAGVLDDEELAAKKAALEDRDCEPERRHTDVVLSTVGRRRLGGLLGEAARLTLGSRLASRADRRCATCSGESSSAGRDFAVVPRSEWRVGLDRLAHRPRAGARPRGERAHCGETPVAVAPDVGLDRQRALVGAVDDAAARLAAALRARLAEAGRDRDDDAALPAADHLELVPLADRRLVDVAADDQLGAGVDELREHVVPPRDRLLPRAPRCADHLVVEHDDAQRARRCRVEASPSRASAASSLTPPDWWRHGRTELRPTTCAPSATSSGSVVCHCRSNSAPGLREPGREGVRDVVVPRDGEHREAEAPSGTRAARSCCSPAPAVGQIAARDHEAGRDPLDQARERLLQHRVVSRAEMEVGHVQDASNHRPKQAIQ